MSRSKLSLWAVLTTGVLFASLGLGSCSPLSLAAAGLAGLVVTGGLGTGT